jgi:PAS domain S-box-containing protein
MKKTFEQIKQSEDRLRKIIDEIPALVWCGLSDGSKEFFNQRWHDYTGLSPEESNGWGWKVTIHPDDIEKLIDTCSIFVASGEPGAVEARIRRFGRSHATNLSFDIGERMGGKDGKSEV